MENAVKAAVITGVSSGISLALTKKLLAEHYTVIGATRLGKLPAFDHPRLHVVPLEATGIYQAVVSPPKPASSIT
jgi:NAD(P)-dependent dehydrogenase (short-subunit alcohol dehydrogenase family)